MDAEKIQRLIYTISGMLLLYNGASIGILLVSNILLYYIFKYINGKLKIMNEK